MIDLLRLQLFEIAARDTIERLTAELSAAREENEQLKYHNAALMDMNATDWQKLVEWLKNPNRKPAMFAFTAGLARQAASAVEQSGVLKDFEAGRIEPVCSEEMEPNP